MLNHFDALTKVLIDQSIEFQILCNKTLINHRTTFRDHKQADGLVERVVQMMKRALHKYVLQKGHLGDLNIQLPWLVMEYQFSCQTSLASFSSYFLLYGRDTNLSTVIRCESSDVVNLDDSDM